MGKLLEVASIAILILSLNYRFKFTKHDLYFKDKESILLTTSVVVVILNLLSFLISSSQLEGYSLYYFIKKTAMYLTCPLDFVIKPMCLISPDKIMGVSIWFFKWPFVFCNYSDGEEKDIYTRQYNLMKKSRGNMSNIKFNAELRMEERWEGLIPMFVNKFRQALGHFFIVSVQEKRRDQMLYLTHRLRVGKVILDLEVSFPWDGNLQAHEYRLSRKDTLMIDGREIPTTRVFNVTMKKSMNTWVRFMSIARKDGCTFDNFMRLVDTMLLWSNHPERGIWRDNFTYNVSHCYTFDEIFDLCLNKSMSASIMNFNMQRRFKVLGFIDPIRDSYLERFAKTKRKKGLILGTFFLQVFLDKGWRGKPEDISWNEWNFFISDANHVLGALGMKKRCCTEKPPTKFAVELINEINETDKSDWKTYRRNMQPCFEIKHRKLEHKGARIEYQKAGEELVKINELMKKYDDTECGIKRLEGDLEEKKLILEKLKSECEDPEIEIMKIEMDKRVKDKMETVGSIGFIKERIEAGEYVTGKDKSKLFRMNKEVERMESKIKDYEDKIKKATEGLKSKFKENEEKVSEITVKIDESFKEIESTVRSLCKEGSSKEDFFQEVKRRAREWNRKTMNSGDSLLLKNRFECLSDHDLEDDKIVGKKIKEMLANSQISVITPERMFKRKKETLRCCLSDSVSKLCAMKNKNKFLRKKKIENGDVGENCKSEMSKNIKPEKRANNFENKIFFKGHAKRFYILNNSFLKGGSISFRNLGEIRISERIIDSIRSNKRYIVEDSCHKFRKMFLNTVSEEVISRPVIWVR
jgi:hypothetical protein